jgi:hypothetical protein
MRYRRRSGARISAWLILAVVSHLALAAPASAGPPSHPRKAGLDIGGFNHACGTAVDSKGDVYVSSAGESLVKVYSPAHALLAAISNANEPCGLAVDGNGNLYVSEKATGKVVRYAPDAYPLAGSPLYGAPTTIDSSGEAKGIAVDSHDNRVYVAKGTRIAVYLSNGSFEANLGEGDLNNAVGVAAYTYPFDVTRNFEGALFEERVTRYLFVADAASNQVKIFSGEALNPTKGPVPPPKLRRTITSVDHDRNPETPARALGFGPAGAYVAVDPGNRNEEEKCTQVGKQACTAGHFLLYDDAHEALDEFEASGEFLDQITDPELTDAEPSAMAVDRSGGPNDGTIYVSTGPGAGAKLLAFGPLTQPDRKEVPARSHVLANARAVATDRNGSLYAAAGSTIHVYGANGTEVTSFEDVSTPLEDLAVDSTGKVYVLENESQVTYYTPSAFPPTGGTTYSRHEPVVAKSADFGGSSLLAIAINPGPGGDKDHLFVTTGSVTHEHNSAANGSTLLDPEFAKGLCSSVTRRSIGVHGANGNVYFGGNSQVCVVDAAGKEVVAKIGGAGAPGGLLPANPMITVDQANGHVLIQANDVGAAREYDAAGGFVAEFGGFTTSIAAANRQRIAIDNSCALHEPPLTENTTPSCEEFDPAAGNAYVAFDDTKPGTPDVWAFDRLQYSEPPVVVTGEASGLGGGAATLNGTVNPVGFEVSACRFEYLSEEDFQTGGETFAGATQAPCVPGPVAIGTGKAPVAVHADIGGLDPEERYLFRIFAENEFGASEGEPVLFGPPVPTTKPATPVLFTEATLRGSVDPSGLDTKYHFEYGETEGALDHSTPVGEIAAEAGPTEVKAVLLGLAEGVEYHFRLVAENAAGTIAGPELAFVTLVREGSGACPNAEYRFGASANLPDCRAYELVTPAETNGLTPFSAGPGSAGAGFNHWLVPPRGTGAGELFSYFTTGTLPGFDGSGRLDGYHAKRGPGDHPEEGWSTELFGLSFVQAGEVEPRSRGISADQAYSFWRTTPLTTFEGTLPAGNYVQTPDDSAAPACNPVLTQSTFEFVGCGTEGTDPGAESRYLSSGGTHVIFASTAHLEQETAPLGTRAVYDRAAGSASAQVISLKPDGSAFGAGENASFLAASEDGEAVLFSVGGTLYLRRQGQTFEIATAPSTFAGVSADGTRVFYVASGSGAAPAPLFACEVLAGPCAGGAEQIAAAGIFLNVSADGSRALFTSEEALTGSQENESGEEASAGEHNLYLWDENGLEFVAILAEEDFDSFGGIPEMDLTAWSKAVNVSTQMGWALAPTRSTPAGTVFLFQSHARLTDYDNEGVAQVYRFEATAPAGEELTCPSCNPGNAPPGGDALLEDAQAGTGLAGETIIPNVTDDGGEVFFQSPDQLVPADANQATDVYRWRERDPAAGCSRPGGCLALISSGQGEGPSVLYAMSADGHDVFFRTRERLLGADVPGSTSIYDAREGGGIPEPVGVGACQGDACQGNGTPPPTLPAPTTTAVGGSGNVKEATPRPRCRKGRHRVRGRCVPKHKKHRRGGRR